MKHTLRWVPLLLMIALGLVIGLRQVGARNALEKQLVMVRNEAAEARQLTDETAAWRAMKVDTNELARLRADKIELLRLRGAMRDLRAGAAADRAGAAGVAELQSRASAARKEAHLIEARMVAEEDSERTQQAGALFVQLVRAMTAHNQGVVPRSWAEIGAVLNTAWTTNEERRGVYVNMLEAVKQELMPPSAFELLSSDPRLTASHPGGGDGRVVLLREREPRVLPDGGSARVYGFMDGTVEEVMAADGNFTPWEEQNGLVAR